MARLLPLVPLTTWSPRSAPMASSLSRTGSYATASALTLTKQNSSHSNPVEPTLNMSELSGHRLTCRFPAAGLSRFVNRRWYDTSASSSMTSLTGNPTSKSWLHAHNPLFEDYSLATPSAELTFTTGALSSMPSHSQFYSMAFWSGPTEL